MTAEYYQTMVNEQLIPDMKAKVGDDFDKQIFMQVSYVRDKVTQQFWTKIKHLSKNENSFTFCRLVSDFCC